MAPNSISRFTLLVTCLLGLTNCVTLQVHDASFTPDIVLRISQINAALACVYRTSVVINGTTPGPPVTLRENVTSWIRVHNDLSDQNATVHWHGLAQSVAPFSDGTPRASQWPIAPGHFFDYEIRPAIGEAGTYFYHSHVEYQTVSALGPLIVEEYNGVPPYSYADEFVFQITDLYNLTDTSIVKGLTADPFVFSGETEAILVNGKATQAKSANATNVSKPDPPPQAGTPSCGPEIFYVKPDTTYRFRFIGSQALPYITLGIENHKNLTIIEADGSYTQPYRVQHIQVGSGQRFDVLIHTKTQAQLNKLGKSQFYIQLEQRARPINTTNYAILSYTSAPSVALPETPPLTLPQNIGGWLEYALQPLKDNNFPSASEVSRRVYISNAIVPWGPKVMNATGQHWQAEGNLWSQDNTTLNNGTPYLVSIYEMGESAIPSMTRAAQYGGWDPYFDAYPAQVGEVIEIILENEPSGNAGGYDVHPWHAHGGHYYDIGSGPGKYDPVKNEKKLQGYKPVLRDTTMVYKDTPGDANDLSATPYSVTAWRGWRLRVTNAGVWMVHCHTLQVS